MPFISAVTKSASLQAPYATLSEGRFMLMSTTALTRGRGWALFGAYVLAFVLYMLVGILVGAVEGGVRGALGAPTDAGQAITVSSIVGLVVQGLVAGLGVAIMRAPAAQAYRQITGEPGPADTF